MPVLTTETALDATVTNNKAGGYGGTRAVGIVTPFACWQLPSTGLGSDLSASGNTAVVQSAAGGVADHPLNDFYEHIDEDLPLLMYVAETVDTNPQFALVKITQSTTEGRVVVALVGSAANI